MTLDIPKFIENAVRTQSKIHHLDINVKAVKTDDIPDSVASLISKDYGEKYLDDADYVTFFWGGIERDDIEKLFNTVDKALGKSANKLTDKDFKKIRMDGSDDQPVEEPEENPEDDENEDNEEETDIETSEETFDSSDEEEPEEGQDSEEDEEESDNDEEVFDFDDEGEDEGENELNEDDEDTIEIGAEENEENMTPTAYFFLKITTK